MDELLAATDSSHVLLQRLAAGDCGPRPIAAEEIDVPVDRGWTIESIEPAIIDLIWNAEGALTRWSAITRR